MSWARELWNSWFGTGGEKYFRNPLLEPVACWRALPVLTQCEILEYLDSVTLNDFRRVAKYERYLVEDRHGYFMVVPARNWNLLEGKGKLVCDSTIKNLVTGMSGKVIRRLDITEMPPFPTELLQSCISYPRCVVQLKLTYFDVELIHKFLTQFKNLRSFEYRTSKYRLAPNAMQSWLKLGAIFRPSKIPKVNESFAEFITQGLPAPASLHLPNLTTLTLCLEQTSNSLHHSDWANVLYLLLAVTPVNLKSFQFSLKQPTRFLVRVGKTVTIIILCILAEFMGKAKKLQKFSFHSNLNMIRFPEPGFLEARPVLRALIERFGSLELENILRDAETFPYTNHLITGQSFVGRVASRMGNLRELSLELGTNSVDCKIFRTFIQKVPALERLELHENDPYNLLVHPRTQPAPPGYLLPKMDCFGTLQKVEMKACIDLKIQLESLLEPFPRLKELRLWNLPTDFEMPSVESQHVSLQTTSHGPGVKVFDGRFTVHIPDLIVQIDNPARKSMFERLTVLQLKSFCILTRDVANLKICRNLEDLSLEIATDRRHQLFGIESKDLLQLLASLRKLQKVRISGIQFPGGANLNHPVALRHQRALEMIGHLQLPEKIFSFLA